MYMVLSGGPKFYCVSQRAASPNTHSSVMHVYASQKCGSRYKGGENNVLLWLACIVQRNTDKKVALYSLIFVIVRLSPLIRNIAQQQREKQRKNVSFHQTADDKQ